MLMTILEHKKLLGEDNSSESRNFDKSTFKWLRDWDEETYYYNLPKLFSDLPFSEYDWNQALKSVMKTLLGVILKSKTAVFA